VVVTSASARSQLTDRYAPALIASFGSGLKVDALTDAVGSEMMPRGGVNTGFGGTARQRSDPAPWLLLIAAGTPLTVAGLLRLRRSRRAGEG
jgi:hypothetical protein